MISEGSLQFKNTFGLWKMCSCLSVSFLYTAPVESNPQTPLRFLCADGLILKNACFYWKLNIVLVMDRKILCNYFENKPNPKPLSVKFVNFILANSFS